MRKALVVAALAGLIAGYGASRVEAKAEYTKKEGKACIVCHTKNGSKDLNDVGKCYAKNDHSLKGCIKDDKDKDKKEPPKQ